MKIAIGADHGGFELKRNIIASYAGAEFIDVGCTGPEACDFPDYADAVAEKVALGEVDFGVLVCRTGMGMTMAANRFQNVRAALCLDSATAVLARQHNGANVLCMGAAEILKTFVSTSVDAAERHARRRAKIERAGRLSDFSGLAHDDPEVYAAIRAQVTQEDTEINLIASENTSSRAVRLAAGSVLMNKSAPASCLAPTTRTCSLTAAHPPTWRCTSPRSSPATRSSPSRSTRADTSRTARP